MGAAAAYFDVAGLTAGFGGTAHYCLVFVFVIELTLFRAEGVSVIAVDLALVVALSFWR